MPIKIKLGDSDSEPKKVQKSISLKIKKTLGGNLLIDDHEYMDIVIVPGKGKVMSMPKPYSEKDPYEYQRELMYSLFKGGIVEDAAPQAAAQFGVLEATYPTEGEVDTLQALLLQISEYLEKTKHSELAAQEYDKHIEDRFIDPSDQDSTESGEVPPYQDTPEGSGIADPTYTFAGYGYLY
jgi:rRNA maturation protein Nop10